MTCPLHNSNVVDMTTNPYYSTSSTLPSYLPVPQINASLFKWNDGVGTANASVVFSNSNKVPPSFNMISTKTGKIKTFNYAMEEAIQYDSWDGEFSKFYTNCGLAAIIWNY